MDHRIGLLELTQHNRIATLAATTEWPNLPLVGIAVAFLAILVEHSDQART